MPYKKNYKKRSRRRYNSRLADSRINTLVEKRMQEIGKKLDRKNDKIAHYSRFFLKDGEDWDELVALPPQDAYITLSKDVLKAYLLSDFGGTIHDADLDEVPTAQRGSLTVGVSGIQCRLGIQNRSTLTCQVTVQIVYVPNYNDNTDEISNYLRPDQLTLYKYGTGNILYDGWNKDQIKNISADTTQAMTTSTVIARKTFRMAGQQTITDNKNYTQFTKRITLQKVWKNYKKHNIHLFNTVQTEVPFSDGNYFLTIHSDLPIAADGAIHWLGASTLRFKNFGSTSSVDAT